MSELASNTSEIRAAYRDSLQARRDYRRAVGGPYERMAHEALHEAVLDFYDVLRPMIKSSTATEELWSEVKLWPVARRTTEVAWCRECDAELDVDDVGELCFECRAADDRGAPVLEAQEVAAFTSDGEPAYRWARGLQTLDNLRIETEVVTEQYTDALGKHERTREVKQLTDAEKLLTLLDHLDEAVQELGLLAEVDDDLPQDSLGEDKHEAA